VNALTANDQVMKRLIASNSWATLTGWVIDLGTQSWLGEAEVPLLEDEEEVEHSVQTRLRPHQAQHPALMASNRGCQS